MGKCTVAPEPRGAGVPQSYPPATGLQINNGASTAIRVDRAVKKPRLMAPRTDAVPIDAKTDRKGDPTEGGGGALGSEDATAAKVLKKAAKPKAKDPNATTLVGSDDEGRYFYGPCNLTMTDPATNEDVLVQDWVVVQLPPAVEGGPKRFECRKRSDPVTPVAALPPYPVTTQEEWDSKTSAVRRAMVNRYVEYNFRPFLEAVKENGGDDQSEFDAANTFCYAEADKLVPQWEDAADRYGSAMTTPVQFESNKPNDMAQNSKFDRSNNRELRHRAYDWSISPLMINNFLFAKDRFKAAFKTAPFNLNTAIPNHSRMFPGPEHEAIQRGMLRKPSEVLKGEGSRAQTWAYNKDANQMVEHAVYDPEDGMRASDDQLEGFRREFDATRQLMIDAYLRKWFPSDDATGNVDSVETTFGAWRGVNAFDPRKEAEAMVPAFNQKYGFQHYQPQTAPGSSMPKKKQGVAETAYDWKAEDGFAGVSKRFADLNKAVTVEGKRGKPGKKVFIGTPIDLLWVDDPGEFYGRYKAAAKPAKAKKESQPRKRATRETPEKKTDGVAELVSVIPPETYLKLLVQTYLDRKARKKAHDAEIEKIRKGLPGKEQAFRRGAQLDAKRADYKQKDEQERQKENTALAEQKKMLLQKTNLPTLSAQISQEEIELLNQLATDEQRFTYLRMKYHIDLKIIEERIRDQPKEKERLKTRTDTALKQQIEGIDSEDDEVPANAAVPSDEMAVDSSPAYSSSDERVGAYEREEIRFAYLASIKRTLQDKKKAEEIYNGEVYIMTKKKKKALRDKFIADAELTPEQREASRKEREANAKAARGKGTPRKPKVPYDQMGFDDKMKEDAKKRTRLRNKYKKSPGAQAQYDVYVGLFEQGMFSESEVAKLARENSLYSVLYADWKKTKNQRESNKFHTMVKAVLQYFYMEFDEYREQKRFTELTPDERKKEADNRELKKEQDAFQKAVKSGDKATAMFYVTKDWKATIQADEQDRLDSIKEIVEEYTKKLADITSDQALYATFDSGAFANELMKQLTQVQKDDEKIRKSTFDTYTDMEANVNELPESEVAQRKQTFGEQLKESAATRVRTLLQDKSIAELVGEDAAALLSREEERKQSTEEARAKRRALLESVYSSVIAAGSGNPDQQRVAMRVAVGTDTVAEKIRQLEAMDKEAKQEKEKTDYEQNAALRTKALLASFNRFLLDVQKYNAMNNSETLQPLFEAGGLVRKPDALREGLAVETVAESILSPALLRELPKLPAMKKPQPKTAGQYVEDALAWQFEQVERMWYQKDRAGKEGLDSSNPDDALDLKYMYEDTASYEKDVLSLEKDIESKLDFERLWEVLGKAKSKDEFLADSKAAFIREQKVNAAAGLSTLKDDLVNVVAFLVTKRVGFSTSAKKLMMGDKARMRYFSLDAFQGRDKIGFANSRLEPFMKPNESGTWRVVMYDEDGAELEEDDDEDGAQFKKSNVLHFYEDDLDAIPKSVWDPVKDRVYDNVDPSSGDKRYSIYEPPEDEADPEGAKAWQAAKQAYEFARASIPIDDFVMEGKRSKAQAISAVKEYAEMGLLTWDSTKETISNISLPDQFKSAASDTADDKATKAVMLKKYAELRAFLAEYYKNMYDEEDTMEVVVDGSGPAGASDEEEERSDEEEEEEEEEDEEEERSGDEDDDTGTPSKPANAFGALSDDDSDESDSDKSDVDFDPNAAGSDPGSQSEDDDDDENYFDEGGERGGEGGEAEEESGEGGEAEEESDDDDEDDVAADSTEDEDGDSTKPQKPIAGGKRKNVSSGMTGTPSVSGEVVDGLAPAFQRSASLQSTVQRQWWGSPSAWWKHGY